MTTDRRSDSSRFSELGTTPRRDVIAARGFTVANIYGEDGPDAAHLFDLHRADGLIPLAMHRPDLDAKHPWFDWGRMGAIDTRAFRDPHQPVITALFADVLTRNAYAALHTHRAWQQVHERGNAAITGLPIATQRSAKLVSYFNCAWIDLDCYSKGITSIDAAADVLAMVSAGTLPRPTVLLFSGRGLWLQWWLNAAGGGPPGAPVKRTTDSELAVLDVQHALQAKLAHLGADSKASSDLARVAPIAGTLKRDDQRVEGFMLDPPVAYTVDQMADAVGVWTRVRAGEFRRPAPVAQLPPRVPFQRPLVDPVLSAHGRDGKYASWTNLRAHIENIIDARGGGFRRGCRNSGAFYLALASIKRGEPHEDVRARLIRYARGCSPALRVKDIDAALREACKPRPIWDGRALRQPRYARVWRDLQVTAEEAATLKLPHYGDALDVHRPKRADRTKARHVAMRRILEQRGGAVPTVTAMIAALTNTGITASIATIERDYAALGWRSDTKRGRPRGIQLALTDVA